MNKACRQSQEKFGPRRGTQIRRKASLQLHVPGAGEKQGSWVRKALRAEPRAYRHPTVLSQLHHP